MIPQIITIILALIGLLVSANQHNKPKEGNESFWRTLIAFIIQFTLLYFGGFYDNIINRFVN